MFDDYLYKAISVFVMGMLGIWKSVPLGFVLKMPPVLIFMMSALGSVCAVLILYFFGNQIKVFFTRKKKDRKPSKKTVKAQKIFEKYGSAGLGLLGTLFLGPNLTIVLGLALVKSQKVFLWWTISGAILWSLVLTIFGFYGLELFQQFSDSFRIF
jgi:membrane protein DedA with SNARE-associated domain